MFFRRQEGEYRETDRVTRFKLIKSGKHWLRASTSQFGLFKVLRGGVDAAQVTTEVIEEQSANTLTGLDILKGLAAAGTVLGGAVATQTTVYANDALEKTVESNQTLAIRRGLKPTAYQFLSAKANPCLRKLPRMQVSIFQKVKANQ